MPGSYVRVRLEQAVQPHGLSVPQRAILRDSAGEPKVLVVDPQARVSEREVVLGNTLGDRWIVSAGLAAGELARGDEGVALGKDADGGLVALLEGGELVVAREHDHLKLANLIGEEREGGE